MDWRGGGGGEFSDFPSTSETRAKFEGRKTGPQNRCVEKQSSRANVYCPCCSVHTLACKQTNAKLKPGLVFFYSLKIHKIWSSSGIFTSANTHMHKPRKKKDEGRRKKASWLRMRIMAGIKFNMVTNFGWYSFVFITSGTGTDWDIRPGRNPILAVVPSVGTSFFFFWGVPRPTSVAWIMEHQWGINQISNSIIDLFAYSHTCERVCSFKFANTPHTYTKRNIFGRIWAEFVGFIIERCLFVGEAL